MKKNKWVLQNKEEKMKKFSIIALAALLVVALALPAMAIENVFGGYWRTRAYVQKDFTGDDSEAQDFSVVDTRTRIYYTAKFSDNLKLVNKFEMDAFWGDNTKNAAGDNGYGDIGADGIRVEVKNTYAEFKLGEMVTAAVGAQAFYLARGFLMDDDAAGVKVDFKAGNTSLPFWWFKYNEGGIGPDANDGDMDAVVFYPSITIADGMTLRPHVSYTWSDNASAYTRAGIFANYEDLSFYSAGLEFNGKVGPATIGLLGIYEGGTVENGAITDADGIVAPLEDQDISAYLVDAKVGVDFGPVNVHVEGFYATGDDDAGDNDIEGFIVWPGTSFYWAEIMGYGLFDNQVSAGAPANKISNIMAGNIGVSTKVMEKVKLGFDVWYAQLAEDNAAGEDKLGTEFDLTATIPIVDKLNLDLVAAYLLADDATGGGDEDPMEFGAQLSLAF
jgi:hypothetical protein